MNLVYNPYLYSDETIKIALEGAVYKLPVYETIDSSLNTTKVFNKTTNKTIL